MRAKTVPCTRTWSTARAGLRQPPGRADSRQNGRGGWPGAQGSPTLGSSSGKCFLRTPKVDPPRARWLGRGSGSTVQLVAWTGSWGPRKLSSAPPAHPGELGPGSGDAGLGSLVRGGVVRTRGQPYRSPVHGRGGLHGQELEAGRLPPLRVGGVEDDQVLLGAHHATAPGHSDCCLQVVPWQEQGKAESTAVRAILTLTPPVSRSHTPPDLLPPQQSQALRALGTGDWARVPQTLGAS